MQIRFNKAIIKPIVSHAILSQISISNKDIPTPPKEDNIPVEGLPIAFFNVSIIQLS